MALSIKSREAEELARNLSSLTGENLTATVVHALQERLERLRRSQKDNLAEQLDMIARRCAALPVLDSRHEDEILGYDETGLPR